MVQISAIALVIIMIEILHIFMIDFIFSIIKILNLISWRILDIRHQVVKLLGVRPDSWNTVLTIGSAWCFPV